MRPPLRPLLLALSVSALCLAALPPRPAGAATEPPPAAADALPHGWLARFSGANVVRNDLVPSASFALPEGEALHPATEVVDLGASYRTSLQPPRPGRYRFGVEVRGLDVTRVSRFCSDGPRTSVSPSATTRRSRTV